MKELPFKTEGLKNPDPEKLLEKLKNAGYDKPFHSLEEGIDDYVRNYLEAGRYF